MQGRTKHGQQWPHHCMWAPPTARHVPAMPAAQRASSCCLTPQVCPRLLVQRPDCLPTRLQAGARGRRERLAR